MNDVMLERLAPRTMLAYARDLSTVGGTLADAFAIVRALFPLIPTDSLTYEYWIGMNHRPVMATFQPYGAEASVASRRPPGAPYRGDIPKIARKVPLGEKESLILDRIDQNAALPSDVRALVGRIYDDVTNMRDAVLARYVKAVIDAVATGALSITDENGMTLSVDFGVPNGQKETLTGDDLWSAATANPYEAEKAWLYDMAKQGKRISRVLTSERIVNTLLSNSVMRELIMGRNYTNSNIRYLMRSELDTWRAAQGLPKIVTLDASVDVEAADGTITTQRYMADTKWIMLPDGKLGDSLVGTTAEARQRARSKELDFGEVNGIWAGQWETIDPPERWTKAAMIAFPTFPAADMIFQADVLAVS